MSDQPQPTQAPIALTLGECLILFTAMGHRLDEAMGVPEFRRIQQRLIDKGLLNIDGDPTTAGVQAGTHITKMRMAALAAAKPE